MNVSLINRKFSIRREEGKNSKLQSQGIFRPLRNYSGLMKLGVLMER